MSMRGGTTGALAHAGKGVDVVELMVQPLLAGNETVDKVPAPDHGTRWVDSRQKKV